MATATKDHLATLFCSMYCDTGRAAHVLQRCGVGAEHINPRQAASVFWTEAFALADRLGLLPRLVDIALADKSVAAFHWQLRAAWEEREKAEKTCRLADAPPGDRKPHTPTSATVDGVTEQELAAARALLTEAATTLGEDAHLVHSAVDVFERLATEACALRAEVARMPGLEQANREAHNGLAKVKANIAQLRTGLSRIASARDVVRVAWHDMRGPAESDPVTAALDMLDREIANLARNAP